MFAQQVSAHRVFFYILFKVFKPYRRKIIFYCGIIVINALLLLLAPLLTKRIVDYSIPNHNYFELLYLIFIQIIIFTSQRVIQYKQGSFFFKVNKIGVIRMKSLLMIKVLKLQDEARKKYSTSYLATRIYSDTENLNPLFANSIASCLQDVLYFLVGVVGMIVFSPTIAFSVLVFLIPYIWVIHRFKNH